MRSFLSSAVVAAAAFLGAAAGGASAMDMVECARPLSDLAPGDVCYGVKKGLEDAGFIPEAFQETFTSDLRIIPPPSGETPPFDLETVWEFKSDGGDYFFSFGFCLEAAFDGMEALYGRIFDGIGSDADQLEFARTCIDAAYEVFDDRSQDAGATAMIPVPITDEIGEQVVFFLIPNNTTAEFKSDPDAFWANENARRPLFSVNGANPGNLNQLVLFHNHTAEDPEECPCDDTARTAFMWEDKTRSDRHDPDNSDSDFGDLVFVYQGLVRTRKFDYFCSGSPGEDTCTEASKHSDSNTVSISFGPGGVRC